MTATPPTSPWKRLALELGPLIVFFAVNGAFGIFAATAAFMAAMAAAIGYSWFATRHVPVMLWVTGALVAVMGGLTLYFEDETFIKVKPTIVYLLFAAVLATGLATGRPLLKIVFGPAFPPLTARGWRLLTINWALFFAFLAGLNEILWRHVSTDTWVAMKLWLFLPLSFGFMFTQVPVMLKHQAGDQGDD